MTPKAQKKIGCQLMGKKRNGMLSSIWSKYVTFFHGGVAMKRRKAE
jgi:hypothetical protein